MLTLSSSLRTLKSLLMAIILGANSGTLTSAWIISPTDASVAAATSTGILKPDLNADPSSQEDTLRISQTRMYQEAPSIQRLPFLFQDWENLKFPTPFRNIFTPPSPLLIPSTPNPTTSSSSKQEESSWSHSIQGESIPCTYKPIWDWQLEYFQQRLTNFQEIDLPDPSLAVLQTTSQEKPATRVRTKWFASDEYRLIRMTYMDGGDNTQIFTTVCYPRADLPIMGHGLLQVGDRRITISDFQPLSAPHKIMAKEHLQPLQEQFPSLNQPMSERFFQQGEFWSDCTLLGRFSKSEEDDQLWENLWPAYQACVASHVQLCQQQESSTTTVSKDLLEQHAAYDAHVASRDPAIKMLTGIFGQEIATKVVYEALFPLADPPSRQH